MIFVRLLVLNPNTTVAMTEAIAGAARAVAAHGTTVLAANPAMGPASIEGYYDEALCLPGVVEEVIRFERSGVDGIVIACFDDTGLDAARTVARCPVVGICEAALHMASLLGTRISVVTTLPRSVPAIERLVRHYGFAERCGVRAADMPVLGIDGPEAAGRIREEIADAIARDRADVIVLGCAGMAGLARQLADEFGLPVVDGVGAAVKLVEGLAALGLGTSKIGAYAPPLPKAYTGELARFAPAPGGRDTPG